MSNENEQERPNVRVNINYPKDDKPVKEIKLGQPELNPVKTPDYTGPSPIMSEKELINELKFRVGKVNVNVQDIDGSIQTFLANNNLRLLIFGGYNLYFYQFALREKNKKISLTLTYSAYPVKPEHIRFAKLNNARRGIEIEPKHLEFDVPMLVSDVPFVPTMPLSRDQMNYFVQHLPGHKDFVLPVRMMKHDEDHPELQKLIKALAAIVTKFRNTKKKAQNQKNKTGKVKKNKT